MEYIYFKPLLFGNFVYYYSNFSFNPSGFLNKFLEITPRRSLLDCITFHSDFLTYSISLEEFQ